MQNKMPLVSLVVITLMCYWYSVTSVDIDINKKNIVTLRCLRHIKTMGKE